MQYVVPRSIVQMFTRRVAVLAAVAGILSCVGRGAAPGGDLPGPVDRDVFGHLGRIPSKTADSALSRAQRNCRAPLTGLLHTTEVDGRRRWDVSWAAINTHLATLDVEAAAGETGHILRPIEGNDTVRADIASIYGTESLSETEALDALRCGRVIARVVSKGSHTATEIEEGTNYLVVSLLQPMNFTNPQWVFVIINPEKRYRASLDAFKYTPHVVPASPTPTTPGAMIRAAVPFRPLSPDAQSCSARGFKACFIDAAPTGGADTDDHPTSGPFVPRRGAIESQPWVPCPLFGCCCGGDACHTIE